MRRLSERTRTVGRLEPAALAALLLLGAALRSLQYLGRTSLWRDELPIALDVEQRSLLALVSRPLDSFQMAPAAFLAAVKLGRELLGVGEVGLRLAAWLSALAALVLFWRVAVRVLAGGPLLAAVALFALSPTLIWYSAAVKPYSGDVAASLLLVLLALRFRERPDGRAAALVAGLAGGAAIFLSYPAIPIAGVLGILLGAGWVRQRPLPPPSPLLLLGMPWAAAALGAGVLALRLTSPETRAYMHRFWADGLMPAPWHGLRAALWIPERLFATFGFELLFIAREWTFGAVYVSVVAALACLGLAARLRSAPLGTALVTAPTLAAVVAAAARLLPLGERVSLPAGWPLVLLAAAGLQALREALPARGRLVSGGLGAALAAVPALLLAAYSPPFRYQESRPVLEALASRWRPGDGLFVYYGAEGAASYYAPRLGLSGWVTGDCHREDPRAYFRELDRFRGRSRVWFFYTHAALGYREPAVIRSYLEAIGEERDRIPDPFGTRGQGEAAAYLYDLSDPRRLTSDSWDRHRFPELFSGGRRVLCDGTVIEGR